MDTGEHICKLFSKLQSQRMVYESTWNDLGDMMAPNRGKFNSNIVDTTPNLELYDSTAIRAKDNLASLYMTGLIDQGSKWFKFSEDLELSQEFAEEFGDPDVLNRIMEQRERGVFKVFDDPEGGFYKSAHELVRDLIVFGTGPAEVNYVFGEGIRYKALELRGVYIQTNHGGQVDSVFHRFMYTARQAAQAWGKDSLGPDMKKALEEDPTKKFEFIRYVRPENLFSAKALKKQKFKSTYVAVKDKRIISEGGLSGLSFIVPRWSTLPGEDYGRGQAWSALPETLMLQSMVAASLDAGQKVSDPQLLVADDGVMLPINPEAGGIIYGGVDPITGRPRVQPLNTGGDPGVFQAFIESTRDSIRNTFFDNTLSSQDLPQMTAEEVATRRDENNNLTTPYSRRIEAEFLVPVIQRTYDLMVEHDMFPKLPKEVETFLKGRKLEIKFTGPLSRTSEVQEVTSTMRWFNQIVLPLAQTDPTVLDSVDSDTILRETGKGIGVPLNSVKSVQEVEAIREERRRMEELQMEMQLAQQADQAEANAPQEVPENGGTI